MAEQLLPGVPPDVQIAMFGYVPDAKIEGMRRAADAWSDSANRLAGVLHGIEASQQRAVAAAANGFTAEAIRKQYSELAEGTRRLMKYSDSMAEQLYEAATEFELEKYMVIGIASVLAAQLTWDLAMGFAGVAPAAAHRAAAGAAMSVAWRDLMVAMAVRGAVIGGLMMGGVRAVAEGIQVAHGDREAVDWKAVRIAATAGAVGGGFGGAVGSVVAPAVSRLGANAVSKTAQNGWRVAAVVAAGVSGGAVGGLTGGLTAGYLTGNYGNLADMVLMGVGGGLVGGLGAGYRSVRTAGYTGASATGDSRNRAVSDLGGIEHTPSHAREPVTGADEGQVARADGLTPEMMAAGKEAEAVVVRDLTPENIANMKPREARAAGEFMKNRAEAPGARRFEPIDKATLPQKAEAEARAALDRLNLGEIRLPPDAPGRPPSRGTPPAVLGHSNIHPPQITSPHPPPPAGGAQPSPGARNATATVFAPAEGGLGRPTASTGQVSAPEAAVRTGQDTPGPGAVADAPANQRRVAEAALPETGTRVENEGKVAGKPEESGHVSTTEEVAAPDIEQTLTAESTSLPDDSVHHGQDAAGKPTESLNGETPPVAGDGGGGFVPAHEVGASQRNCAPEAASYIKEQTGNDAIDLSVIGDRPAGAKGVSGDQVARGLGADWLTYESPNALVEHAQRAKGSIFGGVQFRDAGAHAFGVGKNAQGHTEIHEQVGNTIRKISGNKVEEWIVDAQGQRVGEIRTKYVENAVEQWVQEITPHVESTHGAAFDAKGKAVLGLEPGQAPRGHGPRDEMGHRPAGGADVLERPASELEFRQSMDAFDAALAEILGEGTSEAAPSATPSPPLDTNSPGVLATSPETVPDLTPSTTYQGPDANVATPQGNPPKTGLDASAGPARPTPDANTPPAQSVTPKIGPGLTPPATPRLFSEPNGPADRAGTSRSVQDHTSSVPLGPVPNTHDSTVQATPWTSPDRTPSRQARFSVDANSSAPQANTLSATLDVAPPTSQYPASDPHNLAAQSVTLKTIPEPGSPTRIPQVHPVAAEAPDGSPNLLGAMSVRQDVEDEEPEEVPLIFPGPHHQGSVPNPYVRPEPNFPEELPQEQTLSKPDYVPLPGVPDPPEEERPEDITPLIPHLPAQSPADLPAKPAPITSPFNVPAEPEEPNSPVSPWTGTKAPLEDTPPNHSQDPLLARLPATTEIPAEAPRYTILSDPEPPGAPFESPHIGGPPPRQFAAPAEPVERRRLNPWAKATMGDQPDDRRKRRPKQPDSPPALPPPDPAGPPASASAPAASESAPSPWRRTTPFEPRTENEAGDPSPASQSVRLGESRGSTDYADTRAVIAFHNELLDAAKVACEGTGRGPLEEVQQFTLQRVLSRIFTVNPHDWVLKGGQSMLARIPDARPSTDIDLVRINGADRETMVRDYTAALERDHGDYLRFELDSEVDLDSGGVRMFHKAFIGDREVMTVGIDLNGKRAIPMHSAPEIVGFPEQILRTDNMGPEPELRLLSVQDALAHKVAGMYTYGYPAKECPDCIFIDAIEKWKCQKAGSELPYRPQDMADVLVLALHSSFDGETMQQYLRTEITWRQGSGVRVPVPDRFELPNEDWAHWFGENLKATDALPFRTLHEALPLADEFLSPLFSRDPLQGQWDPQQRLWSTEAAASAIDSPSRADTAGAHPAVAPAAAAPAEVATARNPAHSEGVRRIEGTGAAPPSPVVVGPERIAELDQLAGHSDPALSLDSYLDRTAAADTKSIEDRVFMVKRELIRIGETPSDVASLDDKHLRFYTHQSGEEYIHSLALIANGGTTVEIAYQAIRDFDASRSNAHQSHIGYLGELPEGMSADQANAVAFSRWARGLEAHNVPHTELVKDLLRLQADPLRAALRIRDRLIQDYGIDPSRIQVVRGEEGRDTAYPSSRWLRAHLFTLSEIRERPIETRQIIVDAMRGEGKVAENHDARVGFVLDRLFAAHEGDNAGAKKYTLVWVRDSRPFGQRGPQLDSRPQHIRQMIEMLSTKQPDRQIVLIGDDLFDGRPELREEWRHAGVLDVVDTSTLVKFWEQEGLTRAEQALFFHRLGTERNVVQIGMESGSLETPTVLGVPTVYTSATEYGGNKANRWLHYSEPWEYGRRVAVTDAGKPVYDPHTGAPKTEFHPEGEQLPAPLHTIERVPVGPDLPDPTNRRGQPVALYRPAKVSVTASRIISLIDTGELGRWSQRLGRSAGLMSKEWEAWSDRDWHNSQKYAEQLNRWLHTEETTPERIATKWDAIRLALKGVVEPGYTADETYGGPSVVHPYFTLYNENEAPAHTTNRIATAYTVAPEARARAVVDALAETFDAACLRDQAAKDLSVFRLEPSELAHLHEAIDRVVSRNPIHRIEPYDAPPGGSAWNAPGAATHSKFPPLERLSIPDYYLTLILDGDTGGGHRYGTGTPGTTEFPERWDDATAVRYIKEIAAAPDRALFQANGYWNVIGVRDGVTVTVIVGSDGRIRAAWPEYGRGVFRNPLPGSSAGRIEVTGPR
ncbi:nucleotidyl transferase AbiEii/AbiGii toxin family protein [Nocardia sp. NBC_01009]|uniref:nucleotidyl transferase AbiEii/AbiGii toxin family protein n=1 Tax=Nocardia sp. NBC_01009 TaxID=2975996 RepID=UPI003870D894|nr:nucleotidyl transferase AbiEii/AbiGii toxin family protein [Nocardia sp. NBC_01009]